MIKEKAMELVAALRSGNYKQGRGCLNNQNDRFCCLGVACDLSPTTNWSPLDYNFNKRLIPNARGSSTMLDPETRAYFDFFDRNGSRRVGGKIVIDDKHYECLADANDAGVTFAAIADYIEQNWEFL